MPIPINYRIEFVGDPFPQSKRFINKYETVLVGIVNETQHESKDIDLPILSAYPPNRAEHPFEFATAKSRRWYFAQVKAGKIRSDGYGYLRNNAYKDSWVIDVKKEGDTIIVRYRSTFKASTYISGKRQVSGHKNTGWIRVDKLMPEMAQRFMDRVGVKYDETLRSYGSLASKGRRVSS